MSPVEIVALEHQDRWISIEIRNVLFEAYSLEAQLIGATQFPPLSRSPSDIASSPGRFFGAVENGILHAVIEVENGVHPDSSLGISSLGVAPRCARKGLGSALVKFVLSLGAEVIRVSTASANVPAIALYKKTGFRIVGSETNQHGIFIVHLERHIAA